jgi:RNA polymerase-binding transcription factor DksA
MNTTQHDEKQEPEWLASILSLQHNAQNALSEMIRWQIEETQRMDDEIQRLRDKFETASVRVELRADDDGIVRVCLDCGANLGLATLRAIDDAKDH